MIDNQNHEGTTLFSEESTPKKRRKKRSLFKSQLRMLIILGVLIVLLGVGTGLALHLF